MPQSLCEMTLVPPAGRAFRDVSPLRAFAPARPVSAGNRTKNGSPEAAERVRSPAGENGVWPRIQNRAVRRAQTVRPGSLTRALGSPNVPTYARLTCSL